MADNKTIEELYNKYGLKILKFLDKKFPDLNRLEKKGGKKPDYGDTEEVLNETFVKLMSIRLEGIEDIEAYLKTIARNLAIDKLKKRQKLQAIEVQRDDNEQDEGSQMSSDDLDNPETGEEELGLQQCMEKALAQYERDYPHALCPLLVTLSDEKRPIEEIADIIHRTVPETQKLLKQCQKQKKRYKNGLSEYQKTHGLESLCWLILQLQAMDWSMKEIGKILGKSEGAARISALRCREKLKPYVEKCKDFL